jgi:uncharacterized protein YeaO (DUF488 family)
LIRIARIYEPIGKRDGWRVLVDRLWPRGVSRDAAHVDYWAKEIAPSDALRRWFAHKPERWPEFRKRYRAELTKKKELIESLRKLQREHGKLTLLFGAKDKRHNQAVVLQDLLKGKRG